MAPVALGSGGYFSVISLVVSIFIYIFATKSTKENEYEEVITTISNLRFNKDVCRNTLLDTRSAVLLKNDLDRKDVPSVMRRHLQLVQSENGNVKKR